MRTFAWIVTLLGSLLGTLIVIIGVAGANGAPQEAAAAAIGLACVVIPYCLARAVSELRGTAPAVARPTDATPPRDTGAGRT